MKIPFGEQAYATQSLNNSAQELINLHPEHNPNFTKERVVSYPTPGTLLAYTVGIGPIRALYSFVNNLYAISGTQLYQITSIGTTTLIGTILGNGRLNIDDNGFEMCIVNGSQGYIYTDATSTLTQITDPDFYPTSSVAYQSRRFIFPRDGTNQFFLSGATAGLNYDGGDFNVITTNAGDVRAILADHGEIWLFGKEYINVWVYNQNEATFPFSEIQGANIEKGLIGIHTPVKLNNTIYWLAEDRQVYSATGYSPVLISPPPISRAIQNYSTVDDAFTYTYSDKGHDFLVLTFPTEDVTWVYDASIPDPTKAWHQRQTGTSGRHLSNCYAKAFGKHYVGDYRSANIYEYSETTYTDNGQLISRIATSPAIHAERKRLFVDRIEVDIESGVGTTNGQGENPQAILTYSDDGGKTWSNERYATLGKIGEYSTRLKFHNFGACYQRIFKLKVTDPVGTTILGADAMVEVER